MNFTALLPNGMTKDRWIASLKPGTTFCTRRVQICASCGENSLKHDKNKGFCPNMPFPTSKVMKWQPLPPVLKVGKKYAICSGRGTKAICECGHKAHPNERIIYDMELNEISLMKDGTFDPSITINKSCDICKPLSCELLSVVDEEEWKIKTGVGGGQTIYLDNKKAGMTPDEALVDGLARVGEVYEKILSEEAHREGFDTWQQLNDWIEKHYGGRLRMWRIAFKR